VKVFTKGSFHRDVANVKDVSLLKALKEKIEQIEVAVSSSQVTGLKRLTGYEAHYRIYVKTNKESYRIGAIIRGNTIWLVRFLSRRKIHREFP
jgi:hypothetical protein